MQILGVCEECDEFMCVCDVCLLAACLVCVYLNPNAGQNFNRKVTKGVPNACTHTYIHTWQVLNLPITLMSFP